jgi:hypothetical protein
MEIPKQTENSRRQTENSKHHGMITGHTATGYITGKYIACGCECL